MNPLGADGIGSYGLIFCAKARIDLAKFAAQPVVMGSKPILLLSTQPLEAASRALHARASRMRDIAMMLSGRDAGILDAYAGECEAEAARLAAPHSLTGGERAARPHAIAAE